MLALRCGWSSVYITVGFGSLNKPSDRYKAGNRDIFGCLTENTDSLNLPTVQETSAGELWYDWCLEIGTVITQKCGDDYWVVGASLARASADCTV